MIEKPIAAVEKFHETYQLLSNHSPTVAIPEAIKTLRYELMKEENEEYKEAVDNNDMVEVADALGDMLYILCGTIITHGMQDVMADVFQAIQDSNMSKLGADGQPIYRADGKVMKGPHYFKPDIQGVLQNAGALPAQSLEK